MMGKSGNKLNPNAPEFYPSTSRSYPAFSGNLPITHPPVQMPRNLPTTHPRPTPAAQALHATCRTLVVFDLDDRAVTDKYLYETLRQFGSNYNGEALPEWIGSKYTGESFSEVPFQIYKVMLAMISSF